MTDQPLVSFVILTRNRCEDVLANLRLLRAQKYPKRECIVVINDTQDDTAEAIRREFPQVWVLDQSTNLGVAGGRNAGMRAARGEIIVCIDDDAELRDPEATNYIVQRFRANPRLGILAFQERSFYKPEQIINWHFPGRVLRDAAHEFQTYAFIGAGHAIRRSALDQTGLYPSYYFYSLEEKDLAYRMVDRGFEIWYDPRLQVFHKVSPRGRDYHKGYLEVRNHIWFGIRLLPWPQAVGYGIMWVGYVLVRDMPGSIPHVWRAVRDALRVSRLVMTQRRPISPATRALMRRLRPTGSDVRKRLGQIQKA